MIVFEVLMKDLIAKIAFFVGGVLSLSFLQKWLKRDKEIIVIEKTSPDEFKELSPDEKIDEFERLK